MRYPICYCVSLKLKFENKEALAEYLNLSGAYVYHLFHIHNGKFRYKGKYFYSGKVTNNLKLKGSEYFLIRESAIHKQKRLAIKQPTISKTTFITSLKNIFSRLLIS